MPTHWTIEFYEDGEGNNPVQDYIFEGNDEGRVAFLINVIQSLENLGPDIQGTKMDKHIDGPFRELRKDRHRIIYGRDGTTFVLLTAFMKKTKKTPPEEIELAKKRFEDHLARRKNK